MQKSRAFCYFCSSLNRLPACAACGKQVNKWHHPCMFSTWLFDQYWKENYVIGTSFEGVTNFNRNAWWNLETAWWSIPGSSRPEWDLSERSATFARPLSAMDVNVSQPMPAPVHSGMPNALSANAESGITASFSLLSNFERATPLLNEKFGLMDWVQRAKNCLVYRWANIPVLILQEFLVRGWPIWTPSELSAVRQRKLQMWDLRQ